MGSREGPTRTSSRLKAKEEEEEVLIKQEPDEVNEKFESDDNEGSWNTSNSENSSEEEEDEEHKVKKGRRSRSPLLSPEEELIKREAKLLKNRERQKAWLMKKAPQELEEYKRRRREKDIRYRAQRREANPTEYQEMLKMQREKYKETMKLDPEAYEKSRQRDKFRRLEKKLGMTEEEKAKKREEGFFIYRARMDRMSKEELNTFRKEKAEYCKRWRDGLSGEKKESYRLRFNESMSKSQKKKRQNETPQQREKRLVKERQRAQTRFSNETPEQKRKRLLSLRISQVKRLLKTKREKEGVPPEEIQKEIDQLVEKMRSDPSPPTRNRGQKTANKVFQKQIKRRKVEQGISQPSVVSVAPSFSLYSQNTLSMAKSKAISFSNGVEDDDGEEEVMSFHEDPPPPSPEEEYNPQLYSPSPPPPPPPPPSKSPNYLTSFPSASPPPHVSEDFPPRQPPNPSFITAEEEEEPNFDLDLEESLPENCSIPILKEMPPEPWECPRCEEAFNSYYDFKQHYKKSHTHPPNRSPPTIRQDLTKSKKTRSKRIKATTMIREEDQIQNFSYICMKCPCPTIPSAQSRFQTKEKLLAHVLELHSDSYFVCPYCNLLKYDFKRFTIHLRMCDKNTKMNE